MTDDRPKPASFGFDANFDDLSNVLPSTRITDPKPTRAKPKAVKAGSKPSSKAIPKPVVLKGRAEMADKVAKSLGFESREQKTLVLKKRRRTHHDEAVDQLSIRGPVRVLNDFITYCENEHLSYWEAMERLLENQSSKS